MAEGIRDFNVRLMEMAQLNTVAALDFAREMSKRRGRPTLRRVGRRMLRSNSTR